MSPVGVRSPATAGSRRKRRAPGALVVALPLLLFSTACSDEGPTDPEPVEDGVLALELVTDAVASPVYVTSPPGDASRLFILEKAGRVRVVRDGVLLDDPFLDIADATSDAGERGLLGMAFHPDYADNGFVFVHHTDLDGDTRLLRYTASSEEEADPASATVLLQVTQPFSNHNGGQIAFGPDGMLYVGLGDGGSGGDPQGNGQDPSTLLGTLLRIDVDGGAPYAVPADNPFVSDPDGADEVWVYGLRNPWRFSFDALTGDLWIGDVGQNRVEEISLQPASSAGGENYGWNVMEGSLCYEADSCDTSGLTLPVHEYEHPEGCSVTGGYVYRGQAIPWLEGRYLFGDFCSGFVRSFVLSGGSAEDVQDHSGELGDVGSLVSFGEDAAGELYVVDIGGAVHRIVPAS